MKAADIPDGALLEAVRVHNDHDNCGCSLTRDALDRQFNLAAKGTKSHWALRYDLEERLPEIPPKVILAKARALIKRHLLDGCGCGCRGDFTITDAGRELLAQHKDTYPK